MEQILWKAWISSLRELYFETAKKDTQGNKKVQFFLSISLQSIRKSSVEKRFEKEKVTRDETRNSRFWDRNFKIKKNYFNRFTPNLLWNQKLINFASIF